MFERDDPWQEVNGLLLRPSSEVERLIWANKFANIEPYEQMEEILRAMNLHYMVFSGNCKELIQSIDNICLGKRELELYLPTDVGQNWRNDELNHICRLLTNFLSSMGMLIDTTRRIMKMDLIAGDFRREHQQQVDSTFKDNPEAVFLKDLRNYSLHRALPIAMPEIRRKWYSSFHYGIFLTVVIRVREILQWSKLSSTSREFIEKKSNNGQLEFRDMVARYSNSQKELVIWWFTTFAKFFKSEIGVMNDALLQHRSGAMSR